MMLLYTCRRGDPESMVRLEVNAAEAWLVERRAVLIVYIPCRLG